MNANVRTLLFPLVTALVAACDRAAPGGSDSAAVTPPTGPIAWAFDAPPAWDDRITLGDDPTPGRYLSARVFSYRPRDTTIVPQGLLGIIVYDTATWARVSAEPGPPQGDTLASVGGQVFVASLPQSNPFAEGSADARTFDSLAVDLVTVRARFRVLP